MKRLIKVILIVFIIVAILFILLFARNTWSAYASKINGSSTAEAATPIFVMTNGEKKALNDDNTEVEYIFEIKNFNSSNERTETDLKYYIQVETNTDESISFNLYNKDTEAEIPLNNLKTDYIDLSHKTNITHSYKLLVKYDREKTNATADIKENIFVKAYAVQS